LSLSDLLERARFLSSDRRVNRIPALLGWGVPAGLILCGGLRRLHVPPVAISEWDSWGWLHPALNWLGGPGFHEKFERESLYGAFIAFCLRFTGSFAEYTGIQQMPGLAAGVLMCLTWRAWVSLFPRDMALEIFFSVAGLYLIALYLFSPIAMAFKLAVRPEAIMTIFSSLRSEWRMTPEHVAAFCPRSFVSAIAHRSLDYAHKVVSRIEYFFFPHDGTLFRKRVDPGGHLRLFAPTPSPYARTSNQRRHAVAFPSLSHTKLGPGKPGKKTEIHPFLPAISQERKVVHVDDRTGIFGAARTGRSADFFRPAGQRPHHGYGARLDNSRYRCSYGPLIIFSLGGVSSLLPPLSLRPCLPGYRTAGVFAHAIPPLTN